MILRLARLVHGNWKRRLGRLEKPPLILMYHRVAPAGLDPWKLCVSPAHFAAQMAWAKRNREPIRLSELVAELELGRCPRRALVVTFDDGYRDNLTQALPVLEAYGVPATVFCASGAIGSASFWWDRLATLLLCPEQLPPVLDLVAGQHQRQFLLGPATTYDSQEREDDRRCPDEAASSPRLTFYRAVWAWLKPQPPSDRDVALAQIAGWCPAQTASTRGHDATPLSRGETCTLAASALVEIGAHGVTHPSLPILSPAAQREEIFRSKHMLEALVGRPVRSFAYPFGERGSDTATLVREAGFRASCSTESAAVRRDTDVFQLPRVAVGDWDVATLKRTLHGVL